MGGKYRDIPIHDISTRLGPSVSRALPFFHALSGCDTTSQLLGCGKKTAWATWNSMPEMTDVFLSITDRPEAFTITSDKMRSLERFCILMYSKTCSAATLDDARLQLFSDGSRTLENLPPTTAAYYQHVRRSILQACFIWKQSLVSYQAVPNYSDWGWNYDEQKQTWVPHWTDLPDASAACSLLMKCGCQKACRGNFKCFKAHIHCSSMCLCKGGCTNNDAD